MSTRIITKKVYKCVCKLPECRGNGKPWLSKDFSKPARCAHCLRRTWHGECVPVTVKVYKCQCEIEDCPRKGEPWETRDFRIPPRCPGCGHFSWNGVDRRRKEYVENRPKNRSAA